jgi:O-antigen ligase
MFNHKIFNQSKLEKITLVTWALCLLTINSNIVQLINLNIINLELNATSILILGNAIRFFFPFFITLGLALLLILTSKNKIKIDNFLYVYLVYALWQLIIFYTKIFYEPRTNDSLVGLSQSASILSASQLAISLVSIILIMRLASLLKKTIYKKLLLILLIYILIISGYFSFLLLKEYLFSENILVYLYSTQTLAAEKTVAFQAAPRVTGLSRMLLLLFFFIFLYFINNKTENNILKFINYSLLFILLFLIYGMQTRGALLGLTIFVLFYIFLFKDKKIKKLIILILLILPILSFETLKEIKIQTYLSNKPSEILKNDRNRIINSQNAVPGSANITSGREIIYKKALKIIKEKKIVLGYGPNADRYLLSMNKGKEEIDTLFWDSNVSNALLYSYLCGGIVGVASILLIYYLALKQIFIAFNSKIEFQRRNIFYNFSFISLIFLLVRSIFENGISFFGIDLCFFVINYYIVREYNKNLKIS